MEVAEHQRWLASSVGSDACRPVCFFRTRVVGWRREPKMR